MSLEQILERILSGFEVVPVSETKPLKFYCKCSNERFLEALRWMGPKELMSMAEEDGQAEGRCHFCNAVYLVGKDRLLDLARGSK